MKIIDNLKWNGLYNYTIGFFKSNPNLKVGAEIGVAGGFHIKALLNNTEIEKIYGIDPYIKEGWMSGMPNCNSNEEFNNLFEDVKTNLKEFGDKVKLIRKTSVEAANDFENESLDFVFIDGFHDYENCKNDIDAWIKKIKPNGFIMGHDYTKSFPGVIAAVKETFGNSFTVGKESVWYKQL